MTRVRIFASGEMDRDSVRRVEVDGVALCVVRLESGRYHAIRDVCTHHAIRLSRGDLIGDNIECPAHSSMFNVITGAVTGLPATEPVQAYVVDETDGSISVEIPDGALGLVEPDHSDDDWGDA